MNDLVNTVMNLQIIAIFLSLNNYQMINDEILSMYLWLNRQPFVRPWPLFQFLDSIYSRQDSLEGRSAYHKAATYTQNYTITE
jgi:hypothetical protein